MNLRLIGFLLALAVAGGAWITTCGAWQLSRVVAGVAPLEPRHFERLTLIALGTGDAHENPDRRGPATAIGLGTRIVLVDAGRGVADALRAAQIPVSQPEAVLLTSVLPENTVGLDDLALTGWLDGRSQPLRLIGPRGTRALADGLAASHRRGIEARARALELPPAGAALDALEIEGGWSDARGSLAVRAGALPGGPIEAVAYRFEAGGRSAVVSGTGWAADALVDFARGANLLAHEAVFLPTPELADELGLDADREQLRRQAALHTSIQDVGDLAQRAGVGTLVLVRLRPPPVYDIQLTSVVDDDFAGRIVVASDGDEITP